MRGIDIYKKIDRITVEENMNIKNHAVIIFIFFMVLVNASAQNMDNQATNIMKFNLINNGASYEVSRGDRSDDVRGVLVIPASYEGKPVTSIAEKGFYMCRNLTGVIIPSSVETIGYMAFGICHALEEVTISNGVKRIGVGAFGRCDKLKAVIIPLTVESIGDNAFEDCKELATVTLPKGVSLGRNVFIGCKFKYNG